MVAEEVDSSRDLTDIVVVGGGVNDLLMFHTQSFHTKLVQVNECSVPR